MREVIIDLPEEMLICGKCGGMLKPIGKKYMRTEMNYIPAQLEFVEYYTRTYAVD